MKKQYAYIINVVFSEEDNLFIAEVPELEGCITLGKTPAEAAKNAQDAIDSWVATAKKLKHHIPQPAASHKVSGKFNVRLPKQIHKSLIMKAVQEKVSLNQLVLMLLAKALA